MDCRQFRESMSLWIDGILDQQEQKRFIQHMESCENCRRELKEYKNMVFLLRNMEEEPLPEGFHERLHSRLVEETKSFEQLPKDDAKSARWMRWIGAVAAIFVLLFSVKALNKVALWGDRQAKEERMEIESTSDQAVQDSSFSIASAPDASEDATSSQKDSFEEEGGIQEKAEVNDRILSDSSVDTASNETIEERSGKIETNRVQLKTQDVCVTPSTLKMMAVNNGIELVRSDENSVVLKITDPKQKEVLYKELSRIGDVEDVGDKIDLGEVTVIIMPKK